MSEREFRRRIWGNAALMETIKAAGLILVTREDWDIASRCAWAAIGKPAEKQRPMSQDPYDRGYTPGKDARNMIVFVVIVVVVGMLWVIFR